MGDHTFSLKFRRIFPKRSSNDWNKLSVETVEQTTIFKIQIGHKRDHMPVSCKSSRSHTEAKDPFKPYTADPSYVLEPIFHLL